MKVLLTPTSLRPDTRNEALEQLKNEADELVFNPYGRPLTEDELIVLLADCDGFIAGLDPVTENVLKAAKKLKVVSRYGAGVDRVDIFAATALGIKVTNTPGVNAQAVAELALGLMFGLARSLPFADRQVKSGYWPRLNGMELRGKTVGLIGLGAIGRALATMCRGIGMHVIAYDPFIDENWCVDHEVRSIAFDELLSTSDIISLHLPHTETTHHIIGAEALKKMKKGALLINTSRGGLIDEGAAYEALTSGHLRGMALDAYEVEPPEVSELILLDQVITVPHTGAHTDEAKAGMATLAIENCLQILRGEACAYTIN